MAHGHTNLVSPQLTGTAVRTVRLAGVLLLPDEENQGTAEYARQEWRRQDQGTCLPRKEAGQMDRARLACPTPGLVRLH